MTFAQTRFFVQVLLSPSGGEQAEKGHEQGGRLQTKKNGFNREVLERNGFSKRKNGERAFLKAIRSASPRHNRKGRGDEPRKKGRRNSS